MTYKSGDNVEIISTENMFHPDSKLVGAMIGTKGNIIRVDETDSVLPYCLKLAETDSDEWWVGDVNIKLHGEKS